MNHSDRQREILRKIGVDVWKFRAADAVEVTESAEAAEPAESAEAVESAESAKPAEVAKPAKAPPPAVPAKTTKPAEPTEPTESAEAVESAEPAAPAEPPSAQPPHDPPADSAHGDGAESLAPIEREVAACRKCELHASRTHTVFGCGNPAADWMFIGEAPGQHEDRQGLPFVGRAGKLLDRMIAALGMEREQVFIANVLKCRPPNNRDPLPREIEQCEPYLHRQLAVIQPKVIVALGRISAQALLKSGQPLGKLRGREYQYGPDKIPLVVTYHPAYLLRSPEQKAKAWEDLWQAKMIAGR